MTAEQIIKVLEKCLIECSCEGCPYIPKRKEKVYCVDILVQDTLDLIKRQQAEIAELEAEIDKQYEQAVADIKGNIADGGTSCHWCIDRTKAEAIKEFADKLEMQASFGNIGTYVMWQDIDNLVKEMVGADNEQI